MKYTVEQILQGENELILRYSRHNGEVDEVLRFMNDPRGKLTGLSGGARKVIDRGSILYAESVDRKTFVYTEDDVLRVEFTLSGLEEILSTVNFFRCSKSMIINIDRISELKSLASNRIEAVMTSGEKIIISRTYASEFRKILKGVSGNE